MLALEFADLKELDFEFDLLGFSDDELMEFMPKTVEETEMPELKSGDREPFQQMTFTLHDTQVEQIKTACDIAKKKGAFVNSLNENSNGNALSRVCETFITHYGNS